MANICGATAPLAPLLRRPCDLSIYYQYFNPNKIPVFGFGLKRHVPNSGPMTVNLSLIRSDPDYFIWCKK